MEFLQEVIAKNKTWSGVNGTICADPDTPVARPRTSGLHTVMHTSTKSEILPSPSLESGWIKAWCLKFEHPSHKPDYACRPVFVFCMLCMSHTISIPQKH